MRRSSSALTRSSPRLAEVVGLARTGQWVLSPEKACTATGQEVEVRNRSGGISLGGILVILGIVLIIFWSFWWGLIIGLIGLVVFGGFAKGKWY